MAQQELSINTGSTGALGLEHRSDNRYYLNYPNGVVDDVAQIRRFVALGNEAIRQQRNGVTRCVVRALVTNQALNEMVQDPVTLRVIEAAVPTGVDISYLDGTRDQVWMMLGAINHANRQSVYTVGEIALQVEESRRVHEKAPLDRIRELTGQGYMFTPMISQGQIREVVDLWSSTFGWKEQGIVELREGLREEQSIHPSHKGVWFSGLVDPSGRLVSIATGERLDMPLGDGTFLPIVESTEWRRAGGINRHGLMAATVSHLHAQIFDNLGASNPLVIAETNFWSGAHNVGFASGMDVPPRSIGEGIVHQTLMQNVVVGDGIAPAGFRDFTMMYVPPNLREHYYNTDACAAMLQEGVI